MSFEVERRIRSTHKAGVFVNVYLSRYTPARKRVVLSTVTGVAHGYAASFIQQIVVQKKNR